MNIARALRLLLSAALLIAWQQALVHPLVHVDADGSFIHLAVDHGSHGHGGHGEDRKPDLLCDAIAAVTAAVGSAPSTPGLLGFGAEVAEAEAAGCRSRLLRLAYRSQGPPQYS